MAHRIVSISLDPALAERLDRLQSRLGASGRSELVRMALRSLLAESEHRDLDGPTQGILLVVHARGSEAEVTGIKHEFEDVISTQLHSNRKNGCFEVFVVDGPGIRIHEMLHRLQQVKKIESVKLVLA